MALISKEQKEAILQKAQQSAAATEVSFEEVDSFGNRESLNEMLVDIGKYNKMLGERITLINDSITATIPFTRENLYLFCAYTGTGKSTVAANISYPLWKQGRKVLVLSNEESDNDVIFRIACLELGLSFNDYKKGEMPVEQQKRVLHLFPEITKYVKVLDVTFKNGLTTKVEGVKSALEAVKTSDYSCVLIDYYQLIKYSATDRSKTAYENLNDLRVWLGQYIKSSNVPVALFVQLYSVSKRGGAKDIDARIKDCSAIVEPATVIIEVVPNYEDETSEFLVHKDRFGKAGKKVVCPFDKGRFLNALNKQELAERRLDKLKTEV
jgi:replicative DNA helicase